MPKISKRHGVVYGLGAIAIALSSSACSLPASNELAVAKGSNLDRQKTTVERQTTPMPAPRDPQIAVQEEFDAAKKANTIAAWDLFLRRHGDNALASAARREAEVLRSSPKKQ